jgi:hypothetical protein
MGAFDDDPGIRPQFHTFVDDRAPWVRSQMICHNIVKLGAKMCTHRKVKAISSSNAATDFDNGQST